MLSLVFLKSPKPEKKKNTFVPVWVTENCQGVKMNGPTSAGGCGVLSNGEIHLIIAGAGRA
jgi:hypothetical protein